MTPIDPKKLDHIAQLEVNALLEGLDNPELRQNPAFLEKVRKFLAQNNLNTQPQTPGIKDIQKQTQKIPTFEDTVN